MTRVEELFNHEMELASRMKDDSNSEYWYGYSNAVMRVFFGNHAVADHHHDTWLRSNTNEEGAVGYRDGYHKLANLDVESQMAQSKTRPGTDALDAWENEGGAPERFFFSKEARIRTYTSGKTFRAKHTSPQPFRTNQKNCSGSARRC